MKEGKKYPFDSLVYCNIGNPQVGHAESLWVVAVASEAPHLCSSSFVSYYVSGAGETRSRRHIPFRRHRSCPQTACCESRRKRSLQQQQGSSSRVPRYRRFHYPSRWLQVWCFQCFPIERCLSVCSECSFLFLPARVRPVISVERHHVCPGGVWKFAIFLCYLTAQKCL